MAGEVGSNINLGVGYRVDKLDWSIAGNGVNMLSELTWKNITSYQLQTDSRFTMKHIVLRLHADYGWIVSGKNQDSDYDGNNRTQEFSRSNNNAGAGYLYDFTPGLGYSFSISPSISVIPQVGISYHIQHLTIRNGLQTVSNPVNHPKVNTLGAFSGLNSSYHSRWQGGWLGTEIRWQPGNNLKLLGSAAYHWIDYRGEGNWNLRSDFAHPLSFLQTARGSGITLSLRADYALNQAWSVGFDSDYQYFSTRAGTDTVFNPNGSVNSVTRFNGANWQSWAMQMHGALKF
ncbi:MAG: hypothetical protein Q9M26_08260 [Mariprofundales bacterium]|nr:hypothetical protein [Mariprofundales bacterium]